MIKRLILIFCLLLAGCQPQVVNHEIINRVPEYPTLKIASCDIDGFNHLLISINKTPNDKEMVGEYGVERTFNYPSYCSTNYNWSYPICKNYATAVAVYRNCTIYYLDTEELIEK